MTPQLSARASGHVKIFEYGWEDSGSYSDSFSNVTKTSYANLPVFESGLPGTRETHSVILRFLLGRVPKRGNCAAVYSGGTKTVT
jgi:hypothetical protein